MSINKNKPEVKTCPFCDTLPRIKYYEVPGPNCFRISIGCHKCNYIFAVENFKDLKSADQPKNEIIDRWNTRKGSK
jgi:hypothetical protein